MIQKKLPIDGVKLGDAIAEKWGTQKIAGEKVGKSDKFFGNFIKRKCIPEYAMLLTDKVLGIPYEDYAPAEPVIKHEGCEWCACYLQAVGLEARTLNYCPMCGKLLGGE